MRHQPRIDNEDVGASRPRRGLPIATYPHALISLAALLAIVGIGFVATRPGDEPIVCQWPGVAPERAARISREETDRMRDVGPFAGSYALRDGLSEIIKGTAKRYESMPEQLLAIHTALTALRGEYRVSPDETEKMNYLLRKGSFVGFNYHFPTRVLTNLRLWRSTIRVSWGFASGVDGVRAATGFNRLVPVPLGGVYVIVQMPQWAPDIVSTFTGTKASACLVPFDTGLSGASRIEG